jgi:hypothetical protein
MNGAMSLDGDFIEYSNVASSFRYLKRLSAFFAKQYQLMSPDFSLTRRVGIGEHERAF